MNERTDDDDDKNNSSSSDGGGSSSSSENNKNVLWLESAENEYKNFTLPDYFETHDVDSVVWVCGIECCVSPLLFIFQSKCEFIVCEYTLQATLHTYIILGCLDVRVYLVIQ